MQLELDPLSEVPIYQQLRDRIVEAIASGRLATGEQLSPVRRLAVAFGINVATVGKAYDALRREGLVRTTAKSGSVVARGPADAPAAPAFVEAWTARLTTLVAEAYAQGVPRERILAACGGVLDAFAAGGDATAASAPGSVAPGHDSMGSAPDAGAAKGGPDERTHE